MANRTSKTQFFGRHLSISLLQHWVRVSIIISRVRVRSQRRKGRPDYDVPGLQKNNLCLFLRLGLGSYCNL